MLRELPQRTKRKPAMSSATLPSRSDLEQEVHDGVLRLILNRPDKRNALSRALLEQLRQALDASAADAAVRVVVLASRGPVFCSGHDLKEMAAGAESDYHELFTLCSQVMQQLRRLPQPVIARVQGLATAAGCQLVAACDLAVAAETAAFATPGVKVGLFCTTPMVPLVRTIAPRAALEMLLTGAPISAQRALELGLVNRVVLEAELDAAVATFVDVLRASSPLTLRLGKAAFYDQLGLSEAEAYQRATAVMTDNALRHDAQEGIAAFLAKRPPQWRGE
jgi:enoyl-CoA hydratase/carnithine racemase